jgi:thiaminase/transcriptional activator TenA
MTSVLFAGLLLATAGGPKFSEEAWQANQAVYQEILKHPFLTGLQDGTLDRKAFAFYLIQDAFYLGEFSRALEITAAKAPRDDWAKLLRRHATDSITEEKQLHETVLAQYGISKEEQARTEPSPEAFGYMKSLVAIAHEGTFAESMAALLPCYWIYWEVGKDLARRGSKDPSYQKWIDAYAGESYGDAVRAVMAIADETAGKASTEERKRMMEHFGRSSRFEWMFWDSAYHRRGWPPH